MIIDYIKDTKLDDVHNDPGTACCILAWAGQNSVKWQGGWLEAFAHCTGMFNQLEGLAGSDYRFISHQTRMNLERTATEMHERVEVAEKSLAAFDIAYGPSGRETLGMAYFNLNFTSNPRILGFQDLP